MDCRRRWAVDEDRSRRKWTVDEDRRRRRWEVDEDRRQRRWAVDDDRRRRRWTVDDEEDDYPPLKLPLQWRDPPPQYPPLELPLKWRNPLPDHLVRNQLAAFVRDSPPLQPHSIAHDPTYASSRHHTRDPIPLLQDFTTTTPFTLNPIILASSICFPNKPTQSTLLQDNLSADDTNIIKEEPFAEPIPPQDLPVPSVDRPSEPTLSPSHEYSPLPLSSCDPKPSSMSIWTVPSIPDAPAPCDQTLDQQAGAIPSHHISSSQSSINASGDFCVHGAARKSISSSRLLDIWQAETDCCKAFGGSTSSESVCFNDQSFLFNSLVNCAPKGICIKKLGFGETNTLEALVVEVAKRIECQLMDHGNGKTESIEDVYIIGVQRSGQNSTIKDDPVQCSQTVRLNVTTGSKPNLRGSKPNLKRLEEYKFDGFRFDGVTSMMYAHRGFQLVLLGFTSVLHKNFLLNIQVNLLQDQLSKQKVRLQECDLYDPEYYVEAIPLVTSYLLQKSLKNSAVVAPLSMLCFPVLVLRHLDKILRFRKSSDSEEISLNKQLAYKVDVFLSVYPFSKPLTLLLATLLLLCLSGLALFGVTDGTLADCMWLSWTYVANSGNHADSFGTGHKLVSISISFGGMLTFAMMLGLVSDAISEKFDYSRKGRSEVIEKNHTLILGWSDKLGSLLKLLAIANENLGGGVVVMMAERDKEEMEFDIAKMKFDFRDTSVIYISGIPLTLADLKKISVSKAHAIIVLAEDGNDDSILRESLKHQTFMRIMIELAKCKVFDPGGLIIIFLLMTSLDGVKLF